MNGWRAGALGGAAAIVALAWLFVGIEETPREHRTDYDFFMKQMPAARMIYRNPAVCGECDVAPFDSLRPAIRDEFAAFCRVRYGISEVRLCYAIYLEMQRAADERIGKPTGR